MIFTVFFLQLRNAGIFLTDLFPLFCNDALLFLYRLNQHRNHFIIGKSLVPFGSRNDKVRYQVMRKCLAMG
jgi:hypothetical protein